MMFLIGGSIVSPLKTVYFRLRASGGLGAYQSASGGVVYAQLLGVKTLYYRRE